LIKESWPGILGGSIIFLILLFVFMYPIFQVHDFNEQLIQKVDQGEPAGVLIPIIDSRYIEENNELNNDVNKHVLNINMWGNGALASETDYKYDTDHYSKIKKRNLDYKELRTEFAKREISQEEFLNKINALNY
jgi:hypothetical protein